MKSTHLRALFSLALICLCCVVARADDDEDTGSLTDLPTKAKPNDADETDLPKKAKPKDADELDRELIKSLGGDKETADVKGDDALDRAIRGMRDAGRRILEEDLDDETHDLQEKVVAELDELIRQLKRRPPPSQQNKPQDENQQDQQDQQNQKQQGKKQPQPQNSGKQKQKPQPQKQGGSKQQQSQAKGGESEEKSQESSDKIRNDKAKTAEEQRRAKLDRDVWGHLPPSLREKLLNVSSEKFLPKYEEMVRSYYEALAERNRQAQ